jgi:hypothetical protein
VAYGLALLLVLREVHNLPRQPHDQLIAITIWLISPLLFFFSSLPLPPFSFSFSFLLYLLFAFPSSSSSCLLPLSPVSFSVLLLSSAHLGGHDVCVGKAAVVRALVQNHRILHVVPLRTRKKTGETVSAKRKKERGEKTATKKEKDANRVAGKIRRGRCNREEGRG